MQSLLFLVAAIPLMFLRLAWRGRPSVRTEEDVLFLIAGAMWALSAALVTSSNDLRMASLRCQPQIATVTLIPWMVLLYALKYSLNHNTQEKPRWNPQSGFSRMCGIPPPGGVLR